MTKRTTTSREPERRSARLQAKQECARSKQAQKRKEAPTKPTAAAKRTRRAKPAEAGDAHDEPDKDPLQQMLEAHTRNLLPASWFGVADEIWARGLWSLDKENAMRDELEASPQYARFQRQQAYFYAHQEPSGLYLEAELRLAEILQHRYRCSIADLFRYGLRPDFEPGACDAATSDASSVANVAYASKAYLVKLAYILTHPMWNSIATVRWMLQRVVQARVPRHARPLVPPSSYWKLPFAAVARQWGSAAARAGGAESDAAADAADAAEAEMAWFLFSTDTPRDLWILDDMLEHDEPGYDAVSVGGHDDGNESDASVESAASSHSHLSICSAIKEGRFGGISGSISDCEITLRQDKLRREDHVTARMRGLARTPNVDAASMADEQVFFDLQERDLDCLLALLGDEQFLEASGSFAPERYYAGYIKAHDLLGHGSRGSSSAASKNTSSERLSKKPLLTCSRCAQEYHQGTRDPRDANVNKDGHAHFLHQEFVRGNPAKMLDWLQQTKLEWLATGVREARINAALRADAEVQKGALCQLPDVPPYDPVPMGHLDRVFTHPTQLEVMKRASLGARSHASVVWCLEGQWEM